MTEPTVHDITLDLETMASPYPGDAPFVRHRVATLAGGDGYDLSRLEMSAHSGTQQVRRLDDYPPAAFILPAQVVGCPGPGPVGAADLAALEPGVEAVLFRTANSDRRLIRQGGYRDDYTALIPEAARRCVEAGVTLVGIDYFSVDLAAADDYPVHRILAAAGILNLENADLVDVPPGRYTLLCAPLRMAGAEASPVRALLVAS